MSHWLSSEGPARSATWAKGRLPRPQCPHQTRGSRPGRVGLSSGEEAGHTVGTNTRELVC